MEPKTDWKKTILRLLLGVLVLGGLILAVYLLLRHFGYTDISREELQNLIEKPAFTENSASC